VIHGITPCPYWNEVDFDHVKSVQYLDIVPGFNRLADISETVLKRMPAPIVQICGPISSGGFGHHDKNIVLFLECVHMLRLNGFNTLDQGPLQFGLKFLIEKWHQKWARKLEGKSEAMRTKRRYCHPILRVMYERIFGSGKVNMAMFLPDWKTSWGTRWEYRTTGRYGIARTDFPREWYDSIMHRLKPEFDDPSWTIDSWHNRRRVGHEQLCLPLMLDQSADKLVVPDLAAA
jgi:hypothetical protein